MHRVDRRSVAAVRVAAVCLWIGAACWGMPAPIVARHLLVQRSLPKVFGLFDAYGGGLFQGLSPEAFAILLGLFFGLGVVQTFVGWLLWQGARLGGILVWLLLPFEAVFWLGFALPFPPVVALLRLSSLAIGWRSLR